jgi:hypothetical protein
MDAEHHSWTWDQIVGHVASTVALAGALTSLLPPLASIVSMAWFLVCIYETKTVQKWLRLHRMRRRRARRRVHH